MHVYITESLCCTPETNTRLLINYNINFEIKLNLSAINMKIRGFQF